MNYYDYSRMRDDLTEEQKEAIEYLEEVKTWMDEYPKAIKDCARVGVTNVRMSYVLGVSPTAVNQYRKRHGI